MSRPDSLVLSDIDRLRLQLAVQKHQSCRQQLNNLVLQFLQTPAARDLQTRLDELAKEPEALAKELFARFGVSASEYDLNVDQGAFVPKAALSKVQPEK